MNTIHSYRWCHQLTRRTARNFYPAFLLLSRRKRRAMEALYAFMRVTDDLVDDLDDPGQKRQALNDWQSLFNQSMHSHRGHPCLPALWDTIDRYHIPLTYFQEVLLGVATDIDTVALTSWPELDQYCYRVASVVGLASLHIWGFRDPAALTYGRALGIAFQLTNILRDIQEDWSRGRVYLPQDELQQFGIGPGAWTEKPASFLELMNFQIVRAQGFYEQSRPLRQLLDNEGRAILSMMQGVYEGLLSKIAQAPGRVLTERVRLSTAEKISLLAQGFLIRNQWVY